MKKITIFKSIILIMGMTLCCQNGYAAKAKQMKKMNPWVQSYKLEAKGDYVGASAAIQTMVNQPASREMALLRNGWLHYLQGKYNKAIKNYHSALKLNPQSLDARLGLTLPLMAQKRWREAIQYINQILAKSPWQYTAHSRLMVCEEALQIWKQLKSHTERVAARYPTESTPWVYLGRAELWLGDKAKAKKAYQQVLMRVPGHYEALGYTK